MHVTLPELKKKAWKLSERAHHSNVPRATSMSDEALHKVLARL